MKTIATLFLTLAALAAAAAPRPAAAKGGGKSEYAAQTQFKKGVELLEEKQYERGVKLLTTIAQMYPGTRAVARADLALGRHYVAVKQHELAVRRLMSAAEAVGEDDDFKAEALYLAGIAHFSMNQHNAAMTVLRQVMNKYPGSVYANEASYYIGLCHFSLKRWSQAVEALEKVGTSVPPGEAGAEAFAESGQRFFVKIEDADLVACEAKRFDVVLTTTAGDEEVVTLVPFGNSETVYTGSIPSVPGAVAKRDGTLQTRGGDKVAVAYDDRHGADGAAAQRRREVALVSTASVGFTGGDWNDFAAGVFSGQPFFLRVRDLDRDTTDAQDRIDVRVESLYPVRDEDPGDDPEHPRVTWTVRASRDFSLVEREPRSGVFVGQGATYEIGADATNAEVNAAGALPVAKGDRLRLVYTDSEYMASRVPVDRTYEAKVVVGELPDVASETRVVNDLDVKAKKNLIEAKLLLQLAQIFRDVGLQEYANKRAGEGLDKCNEILRINADAGVERNVLEDTFNAKWELLIVRGEVSAAIAVCRQLIQTFPDSVLADRALMRIAAVKTAQTLDNRVFQEGIAVYRGIISLPKSDLKAEAQFAIAEATERQIRDRAEDEQRRNVSGVAKVVKANYAPAMQEYQRCADNYPDSAFAGKSLVRIADYYLSSGDYARVVELNESVARDYPDADFLDEMLLKWAMAAYKMHDYTVTLEKCERIVSEYPTSDAARKATKLKAMVRRKTGEAEE